MERELAVQGVQPLLLKVPMQSPTSSSEALGLELQHGLEEVGDPSSAATMDSASTNWKGSLLAEV